MSTRGMTVQRMLSRPVVAILTVSSRPIQEVSIVLVFVKIIIDTVVTKVCSAQEWVDTVKGLSYEV